jgi:hypothetical protein
MTASSLSWTINPRNTLHWFAVEDMKEHMKKGGKGARQGACRAGTLKPFWGVFSKDSIL